MTAVTLFSSQKIARLARLRVGNGHVLTPANALLIISFTLISSQAQTGPVGHWEGDAQQGSDRMHVAFDLNSDDSGWRGTFSLPGIGVIDERISRLQIEGSVILVWQRTLTWPPRGHVHDAKFKEFPLADHSIIEFPQPDQAAWPKLADSYVGLTLDWLREHATPKGL